MLSNARTRFISEVERMISSNTGTLPPTSPVFPPWGLTARFLSLQCLWSRPQQRGSFIQWNLYNIQMGDSSNHFSENIKMKNVSELGQLRRFKHPPRIMSIHISVAWVGGVHFFKGKKKKREILLQIKWSICSLQSQPYSAFLGWQIHATRGTICYFIGVPNNLTQNMQYW